MDLLSWRVWVGLALACALSGGIWWIHHDGYTSGMIEVQASWDAAKLAEIKARDIDAERQRLAGDQAATAHAAALAVINQKLGDSRAYIAKLSGRECLGAGTVSMLNNISDQPVPAAAGESEGPAATVTAGRGLRFATERDVAGAIAVCRARYAEVSSQVNQILDIEDVRQSP
jgi:hypothetical protein